MKQHNKNDKSALIRRIVQREGELLQTRREDEAMICTRCFCKIESGRYYEIDGETICRGCIDACECRM